jgi:hypothetical protein
LKPNAESRQQTASFMYARRVHSHAPRHSKFGCARHAEHLLCSGDRGFGAESCASVLSAWWRSSLHGCGDDDEHR